ncbi:MAG: LTA synthase family protein [Clostridia bacterium]|nr:LTA synthase family protein [Clostridia bacterium]
MKISKIPFKWKLNRKTADLLGKGAFAAVFLLNAVCMFICLEVVWRNEYAGAMIHLIEQTPFAAINALFILLFSLVLLFLFGRAAPALAVTNLFFLLMGSVQHFKMEMRGEPFQFSDLRVAKEAMGVVGNMTNGGIEVTPYIVSTFCLMVVLVPLLMTGKRILKKKRIQRAAALLMSAGSLVGCMAIMMSSYMDVMKNVNMARQDDDYRQRGMITAFVNRMPLPGAQAIEEPEGYTKEAVEALLARHQGTGAEPALKPDILFIMSESLYDVTMDLKLSEDPLAYLRDLQQKHWGGSFVSPVYGGSTVVAEYEVLTGYRAAETNGLCFTAPGGVIQNGMSSVMTLLKSYGYYTQAFHPGSKSFYSRDSSYRMLGFDSTVFRGDIEPEKNPKFPYPSDEYMFDQIIRLYENRPKDQPWFCHTVTYQNHGGYGFESDLTQVRVEEELDEVSMLNARNYVNMLKLSDERLRDLIAYFDKQEDPILIVFWGDHAPAIRQFGKVLPDTPKSMVNYYRTPLLVYSNYGQDTSMLKEDICSYRLGAYVMRMLGMDRDPFLNYLSSDDAENVWVYGGLVEKEGVWQADAQLNEQASADMLMLHYDRLYGKKYGETLWN